MTQAVTVPGVGVLNFPDGMSQADMAAAIRKNFPQIHQPAKPEQDSLLDREDAAPSLSADEAAALPSGLSEGARRFWGGVKQLGAGLADAGRFFWGSGPPTMTAPPGQWLQANPASSAAQATAVENARRTAALAAANKQGPAFGGAFDAAANVGEAALNAAPALATDGALAPTTTLGGNIARQAAVGGATGALAFSPTNDKAANAAIGAGGGAVLGTAAGALNAARNVVANAIRASSARSEATYQAAKGVMGWGTDAAAEAGTEPTLAMRTGSPTARSFEAQSFNARLQERYQRIADGFAQRFKDVFNLPDTAAPALDAAFAKAQEGATKAITGMRRAASDAYSDGMAQAARLAQDVGLGFDAQVQAGGNRALTAQVGTARVANPATVRADNFRSQLSVLNQQLSDPIGSQGIPAGAFRDWIKTVSARIDQAVGHGVGAGQGTLSVKDTAGVLRDLSAFGDADDGQVRALANKLRDSFNTDLDLVAQDGSGAHPAVQQVLNTRAAYRAAQQNITALQQHAAFKFLGVNPGESVDPANLTSHFASFTPDKQTQITSYLRTNAPQLLDQMRGKVLQDAAAAGLQRAAPAAQSETDPAAVVDALYGKGQVLKTAGLWNKDEQTKFEGFRQAMRIINNVSEKQAGGAGTIVDIPAGAATSISRNPIFIARWMTRLATAGKGDLIFSNPEAVNYWTKIRTTSGPTQTAAIAGYGAYLAKQANAVDSQQNVQR